MIKNMDINDLTFYCIDCGAVFQAHEIEKKKIISGSQFKAILECGKCSGTNFEIYTRRLY